MAPQAGLEPATYRLTAGCSTIELLRERSKIRINYYIHSKLYRQVLLYHNENEDGRSKATVSKLSRISPRPIRIRQLNTLLRLHLGPIYLVIYKGSYYEGWEISS